MGIEYRVTAYLQSVIRTLIAEKTAQGRETEYTKYYYDHKRTNYDRLKVPTNETLKDLLDVLDVDYKTFFIRANAVPTVKVGWATPAQQSMADMLDSMHKSQKAIIYEIVHQLLPETVVTALQENEDCPIQARRITNILDKCFNENSYIATLYESLGIRSKWNQKTRPISEHIAVPHEFMPAISQATGISLHWLIGWDAPILAKSTDTEEIMDEFCFLKEEMQQTLAQALTNSIRTGGVILG